MKNITYILVAILTLACGTIFIHTLTRAYIAPPREEEVVVIEPVTPATPAQPDAITPDRLQIPVLHVDAHVQHVGMTKKGTMSVPSNYTDVGWYRHGSMPGDNGIAVFDGHVDNGVGLAGVFKHLKTLKAGDDIYIVNKEGKKIHFKVTGIQDFPHDTKDTASIFQTTGTPSIKLITCEGEWNKELKTYMQRLIVSAELVAS
ncbi:MAG: class F sortase [Patescibacteria group bacterium]